MDDHLSIPLLPLAPGSSTIQWYRDVAVWGAVGNLGMTTVGAVVLSLPAAVATIGWMLGLVLLVAFALMADASMVFLVRSGISVAADHPGREGMLDYEQVGRYLLGKWWALAIRATLLCLLVGAMASVNIIVVDMVQGNLQTFGISGTWYCSRWFISLVNIGVMWPFTLLEHLAQLSKVSLLAFASLAYVFVAVMWVCFTDPALAESVQQAQPVLLSPRGFLAVPVMALAYCAQFQVLPVYQSLPQHSRRHMETVIHVAIVALALPIYIGFGMLPYFDLGPDVNSDFLYISWPGNKLMTGARIFLSVMNMLKYPLVALPLRDILCDLIWSKRTTPMTIKGRFLVRDPWSSWNLLLHSSLVLVSLSPPKLRCGWHLPLTQFFLQ